VEEDTPCSFEESPKRPESSVVSVMRESDNSMDIQFHDDTSETIP